MRHLAAALDSRGLRLHPSVEDFVGQFRVVLGAPPRHHIADLGREVSALAVQRVAVDAGMAFPDVLAQPNLIGEGHSGGGLVHDVTVALRRQGHEHDDEEDGSPVEHVPGPRFGE